MRPVDLEGKSLGKYQILRKLGEGGMGVVYKAHHPGLGVDVAVKVLAPDKASDPEALARFRRETTTLARLRHPNLVPVQDCDSEEGVHFFVMPLISRPTLEREITDACQRGEPYPLDRALVVTRGLLEALVCVHGAGIVHRDIKPANVFVEADGRTLLADFGIARPTDDTQITRSGTALGTFIWMSPEQLRVEPADHRSDLYQVGLVLYQLAAGTLPYTQDPSSMVRVKCIDPALPPPRRASEPLPEGLADLVLWMTAREPASRPASAAEALDSLEKVRPAPTRDVGRTQAVVPPPAASTKGASSGAHRAPLTARSPAALPPYAPAVSPPATRVWPWHGLAAFVGVVGLAVGWLTWARMGERPRPAPTRPTGAVATAAGERPATPAPTTGLHINKEPRPARAARLALDAIASTWPGARVPVARDALRQVLDPGAPGAGLSSELATIARPIARRVLDDLVRWQAMTGPEAAALRTLGQGGPAAPAAVETVVRRLRRLDGWALSNLEVIGAIRRRQPHGLPPESNPLRADLRGLLAYLGLIHAGFHEEVAAHAYERLEGGDGPVQGDEEEGARGILVQLQENWRSRRARLRAVEDLDVAITRFLVPARRGRERSEGSRSREAPR